VSSDFTRGRLSPEFEEALRPLLSARVFPKGATLYHCGMPAEGVYLLDTGSVRLLLPLPESQTQLLEVAGEGAILGLSETLSGDDYRVSVEANEPVTASFIPRRDFLEFLDSHHEFCMQVVRLLSDSLHALYHRFRSVTAHPGRPRRRMLDEHLN
jgi:CRP-like cAMP-binding protein